MELKVTDLDGQELVVGLDKISFEEAKQRTGLSRSIVPKTDTKVYDVTLPSDLRPAAVHVRTTPEEENASVQLVCVEMLQSEGGDINAIVRFAANSLVRNTHNWRLFVRDDAWSDRELRSNPIIRQLEDQELRNMRGSGGNLSRASQERKPGDRIYDYDTYCDLGRAPALGGGEFKYPRRLATNRKKTAGLEEKPQTSGILEPLLGDASGLLGLGLDNLGGRALPSPWVPDDDNFSSAKSAGFLGTALVSHRICLRFCWGEWSRWFPPHLYLFPTQKRTKHHTRLAIAMYTPLSLSLTSCTRNRWYL